MFLLVMAPQRKRARTTAHVEVKAEPADPAIHPELAKMDPALLHPDLAAASSQPPVLSNESMAAIAAIAAAAAATLTPSTTDNTMTHAPIVSAKKQRGPKNPLRKNAHPASLAAVEAAAAFHQQHESAANLADLSNPPVEESPVSLDVAAEFLRTIQERESRKNLLALQAQQSQQQQRHSEPIIAEDGSIPTDLASLYPHAGAAAVAAAAADVQAPQQQISYPGCPTHEQFSEMVHKYLASLSPKKQTKALLTQAMYDDIREVLLHPTETKTGSPQFRFWSKRMFRLVSLQSTYIVIHENKPVATKEQLYDVLAQCHEQAQHGGRDKTALQVRKFYSWVPKELIARFVKGCPSCVRKSSMNL
jgi:Integrase zinc binding domain